MLREVPRGVSSLAVPSGAAASVLLGIGEQLAEKCLEDPVLESSERPQRGGVSRVLRGLDLWILVSNARRNRWDDRATRLSSGARSSTCSRRVEASRQWRTTSI